MGIFDGLGWEDVPVVGKVIDPILDPKAPPNLGDTPEAKAAGTYADRVVNAQGSLAVPTQGQSYAIPTTVPVKPIPPAPPPTPNPALAPPTRDFSGAFKPALGVSIAGQGGSTAELGAVGGLTGEAAQNRAAWDKYNADLEQYNKDLAVYEQYQRSLGGPAAQVAAAPVVGATTVRDPSLNFTPGVQAQQIGAPGTIDPRMIGALPLTSTAGVQAPTGVVAGQVAAERIGPIGMENIPKDIDVNSLGREAQLRALGIAEGAALGTAPSAAEALLRKGIDENIGAAMGIAATTQGRNPGLAMRQGQTAAMNAIAKSSADMAALRADEMAKGRALFMEAATGIRAQDISVAQSNQTKDLTVATENLRAKLETAKANQDALLKAGMANQAASLNTDIANMTAQLDAAKTTAELSLRSDIANLTASLDASKANQAADLNAKIANATNQIEVAKANQKAALDAGIANQAAELEAQIRQMQAQLDADKANQAALLDAAKANAANSIQVGYQNATLAQQQDQFRAGREGEVMTANQRAALEQQALDNQFYLGMTNAATNAVGVPLGVAAGDVGRQTAYQQGQQQFVYSLAGALGGAAIGGPAGAAAGSKAATDLAPVPTSYYGKGSGDGDELMRPSF